VFFKGVGAWKRSGGGEQFSVRISSLVIQAAFQRRVVGSFGLETDVRSA